ncbi:MAG: M20/M25/M40 family metallo-hydrolase [Acidobacteriaceae bacterium]|nr:M20/M25/M40 family metallo-hydrolase [Acidobacteriaceae bacterium]
MRVFTKRTSAFFAALAIGGVSLAFAGVYNSAQGQRWWGYVKYLASDELQGRETGSEGHRKAAAYVADQFQEDGLKPAGIDGYIQPVPFIVIKVDQERSKAALVEHGKATPLISGEDVLFSSRCEWPRPVNAPMVFIGYGISAPSAAYDDLKGVDLKGKIAVILSGAGPSNVSGNLRAHASHERWQFLKAAGALGVVSIANPALMDIPWSRMRNNASQPGMLLEEPALQDTAGEQVALAVNPEKAEKFFAGSGHTFAEILAAGQKGEALPHFPLPASLKVEAAVSKSNVVSQNIAGILPGSDPALESQYVVMTAHVDHLGVGNPIHGDAIFNGAMDNASGVASLLEIAKEANESGNRPKRSILFVVVTGEEKGLLGSKYFAAHPTVPEHSMIADINIDMFLPIVPLHVLTVYGLGESTLGATVRKIAEEHGLEVQDDPQPSRNVFIRSDQYNFILHGIPSVACKVGAKPGSKEEKQETEWLHSRYHAPSDDVNQPVDLGAAALFNQIMMQSAWAVADTQQRPTWRQDSFFRRFAVE